MYGPIIFNIPEENGFIVLSSVLLSYFHEDGLPNKFYQNPSITSHFPLKQLSLKITSIMKRPSNYDSVS